MVESQASDSLNMYSYENVSDLVLAFGNRASRTIPLGKTLATHVELLVSIYSQMAHMRPENPERTLESWKWCTVL